MASIGALCLLTTSCSGTPSQTAVFPVIGTTESAADNTARQLAYALAHWNDYNAVAYGDLNPVGGDCANFVSQALIARGWLMNSEWYSRDAAADWSPAWGYVPAMDNYLHAHAAELGIQRLPLTQRDKVKVGDIVMFDWDDNDSLDHVQIVSAIERAGDAIRVKMVGHNKDTVYRDLDDTISIDPALSATSGRCRDDPRRPSRDPRGHRLGRDRACYLAGGLRRRI
ncbi:amidase domain-containing protein [Diaminobutyricibacter sp. McL0618]|uniref:amidase domain-containing protein n=1 Tax=Leifsonia sp. McL0618 TaxID=3415677 RepID=UPI003CF893B7